MDKKAKNSAITGIVLLGLASLLNDIGSEMITPIMPLFLTALGGGGVIVGLVGGLRDSIASIVKLFSGYASDRIGKRKVFVTAGYFISFIFKFLLAFSKTSTQAVFFSAFERTGKIRDSPRDVMISKLMKEKKGTAFGLHQAMDTAGGIIGGILVLILFWHLKFDFRTIIITASVFSFLSLLPLLFVKEIETKPERKKLIENIWKIPKNLWFVFFVIGIFALANFSYMFFILRAGDYFKNASIIGIPIMLFVLFNIVYSVFAYPCGILADRIGKKKAVFFGYLLFAITATGFIFANSLPVFILLFITYGLSYAFIEGNQRAMVADLSPEKTKGSSIGMFHMIKGLLALPASIIAGILWNFTHTGVFIYGTIVSLLAVIFLFGIKEN